MAGAFFVAWLLSFVGFAHATTAHSQLDQSAWLQVPRAFTQRRNSSAVASRRSLLVPLYWLHVPKTGSSFMNTIFHHSGLCPGITNDDVITPAMFESDALSHLGRTLTEMFPASACRGSLDTDFWSYAWHSGLGEKDLLRMHGRGLIMLRDPLQRTLSLYNMAKEAESVHEDDAVMLSDFKKISRGCTVKLLTRSGKPCNSDFSLSNPASEDEFKVARQRLKTHFAFIGLTEEWDLSVCLFHAMFGGACHDFEFQNVHKRSSKPYNVSLLGGFVDKYDGELYSMGQEMFKANLQRFGVTKATCPSACRGAVTQ